MTDGTLNAERLLELYERVAGAPDAVHRLRRFVLDLAVRGKLVEQDHKDDPAPKLLERINQEKIRRIQAGEIRKPRAVPGLKESEIPFPAPQGWSWTRIADLGVISPRNQSPDEHEAAFVPMPMISSEYGVSNGHERSMWGRIKRGYTHFSEGDVGLAKITPCFENGKSTVFRNLTGGIGAGTTELHVVRPILVDPDYILIFLKSPQFIETGIPRMTGTAGQKRVPSEYFGSSPFPLPPLAEQLRIVAKVEELMALLDRLEETHTAAEATRNRLTTASLTRLTAPDATPTDFPVYVRFALDTLPALTIRADQIQSLRQTVLNLAVRGNLVRQEPTEEPATSLLLRVAGEREARVASGDARPRQPLSEPDETELPFRLPVGWTWCRMGSLVMSSDAGWSPRTENHAREGDAWGVIKVSAVSWDRFNPRENKQVLPGTEPRSQAQIHKGDFLISRANTSELVARSVLVCEEPLNLMMSDKIVRLRLSTCINPRFLCIVNNHFDFSREYYAANATGVSSSMKNVSRSVILNLPIPLPPLAEQDRIVAKVDELIALCARLEASLTSADTNKQRLLESLVREALPNVAGEKEAA